MGPKEQEAKRPSVTSLTGNKSGDRRSFISTGRGGAGNIGNDAEKGAPPSIDSLKTPIIKSEHYTTGRGGTGNMAYNHPDVPEMARASQDVVAPPVRQEIEGAASVHHGRGGAANVARTGSTAEEGRTVVGFGAAGSEKRGRDTVERRGSQGWAERGKEILGQMRSRSGRRGDAK